MTAIIESVFITGANRGLGLEFVKQLLSGSGPPKHLFATCRNISEAHELNSLAKESPSVHVIQISDVRDYSSYDGIVKKVQDVTGNRGLNLLINNAGISGSQQDLTNVSRDKMLDIYEVNVVAPLMLTKAFVPLLKQAAATFSTLPVSCARAAVVNVTSQMGSIADNKIGSFYAYRASKAALNMVSQSLHVDLKNDNILVAAIHPGWVQTDLGGPKAPMTSETSVRNMLKTIRSIKEEGACQFLNHDGSILPW